MKKINWHFWFFLAPALFAFVMVMIIPFFLGAYYSFTDWDGFYPEVNFVGLANYYEVFKANPRFIYSILVTVVYSGLNIGAMNLVALGFALLVTQELNFKNFYRAGFFLPNLIGGLILGYIWQFIFNRVLPTFIAPDFLMLENRNTALLAIVIAGTWQYAGYLMIIYINALQNIPRELMDASKIDGAGYWDRMHHIVIPLIAPAFTINTFLTLLYSFKQFDVNYSLTAGGPSTMFQDTAIKSTELISMNIFNEAFSFNNMAVAQAKSVLFFLTLAVFTLMQVYYQKKKEVEI